MKVLATTMVLLATVATALVGVRQQSENRHLERLVWLDMRRRDGLAKQIREIQGAIDTELAPRVLLEALDGRIAARQGPVIEEPGE
ncbi:MAG: hypothetical protein ACC662_04485 [Planctomycetota bacterium]